LWHGGRPENVLNELNEIYQQSKSLHPQKAVL